MKQKVTFFTHQSLLNCAIDRTEVQVWVRKQANRSVWSGQKCKDGFIVRKCVYTQLCLPENGCGHQITIMLKEPHRNVSESIRSVWTHFKCTIDWASQSASALCNTHNLLKGRERLVTSEKACFLTSVYAGRVKVENVCFPILHKCCELLQKIVSTGYYGGNSRTKLFKSKHFSYASYQSFFDLPNA